MEKAILNVKKLKVTQGMNDSYSHKGDLAIDMGSSCSYLKAPFTGVIKRIYTPCNAVWLQSKEKVLYADGTKDYMTILTIHDNDVSNLKKGQVIKKGEKYYHPGKKGNATGSHIHIAVGKGKFKGNGWKKNKYGNWIIYNNYDITKALILGKDVEVEKAMYDWVTEEEVLKKMAEEELNKYYTKPKKQYISFVNALESIKVNSSLKNRFKIAKANGIKLYVGSSSQNNKLNNLLYNGKLIKA
jgi:hypothetical protein